MRALHHIAMLMFAFGMRVAGALGHSKARRGVQGRRGLLKRLQAAADQKAGPWIHVHCASLGEYEQAAPVIEELRKTRPASSILLTFFSPSGHESCPKDAADHIDYLPIDTRGSAIKFAAAMPFESSYWVKYEIWPAHLFALQEAGVPTHLFAAHFVAGRHPLSAWSGYYRRALATFCTLQVQDHLSVTKLANFGLHAIATGDPRYDRVKRPAPALPAALDADITRWANGRSILIAGSSWAPEEEALAALVSANDWPKNWGLLVVPHEVSPEKISSTNKRLRTALSAECCYVVDRVGVLRALYSRANLAVVGGGWGGGIHNILEPASAGLPVAFGPKHGRFREAQQLIDEGGAREAKTSADLQAILRSWIGDPDALSQAGAAAAAHVASASGAAERIVKTAHSTMAARTLEAD